MSELYEVGIDPDDQEQLKNLATIRPAMLEQEMYVHPAAFAYWNAQLVDSYEALLNAKHNFERIEARLYLQTRYEMEAAGAKFTEKVLESRVRQEDGYNESKLALIRAEAEKKRIEGVVRTIQIKGDMLTNIGMRVNAEMKSNPLAAAQARGDRLGDTA